MKIDWNLKHRGLTLVLASLASCIHSRGQLVQHMVIAEPKVVVALGCIVSKRTMDHRDSHLTKDVLHRIAVVDK